MRYIILSLILAAPMADAQRIVYCKKYTEMGNPNAPIVAFEYHCPPGWYEVR